MRLLTQSEPNNKLDYIEWKYLVFVFKQIETDIFRLKMLINKICLTKSIDKKGKISNFVYYEKNLYLSLIEAININRTNFVFRENIVGYSGPDLKILGSLLQYRKDDKDKNLSKWFISESLFVPVKGVKIRVTLL